jgi:hypothetical protein
LTESLSLAGLLGPHQASLAVGSDLTQQQLEKLLVSTGVLTRNGLIAAIRRHTQRMIAKLVRQEKGRFSIALVN